MIADGDLQGALATAREAVRTQPEAVAAHRAFNEAKALGAKVAALTGAAHALDTPFAVGFDSRAPLCASTPPLA